MHLIWVEGIIGAGKSTFAKAVGEELNFRVIEEPVETNPYLDLFYKDPKKYAFPMQIRLLHERYMMQILAAAERTGVGGYKGAILDRSLPGDLVFAKNHMRKGNISKLDWETYVRAYMNMCNTLMPPTRLIYLDVQPETAHERMKRRNRDCEREVPLSYLTELKEGYEELIAEAEKGLLPWSHAVKISRLIWDPVNDSPNWQAISKTVKDLCDESTGWQFYCPTQPPT